MSQPTASFYVLLALKGGPSHGLGIAEDVAAFTEGDTLMGPGTLYRCLRDLQADGAIERIDIDEGPGTAHRKHYSVTAVGEAELRRQLAVLSRLVRVGAHRTGAPYPQAG